MSRPIVILIPAYRCAATITETLNSIQAQGPSLSEIREVIIADDGSRDGTCEVARLAWNASVPLRILERQFNCGEYASVNNAVEQFAPDIEWFLILHADDVSKEGWLEAFVARIDGVAGGVALIGSSYDCLATDGTVRRGEDEPGDRIVTVAGTTAAVADTVRMGCWWHISGSAIRVTAFREVGGLPKMQACGDWDFMLRVLANGWTIEHLPRSLMVYRDNPAGSSSLYSNRNMDIWGTMMVVERFHWAMDTGSLARIHARNVWFLLRRALRCLANLDIVRLLWTLPALGCIVASYATCLLGRQRRVGIAPRRVIERQIP